MVYANYDEKNNVKILDYSSKWEPDSFEYANTYRTFTVSENDRALVDKISNISVKVWEAFGLSGFARVDFRVDHGNNPFVLEINTNPCISPDGGFFAACKQAGLIFDEVVNRIITAKSGD